MYSFKKKKQNLLSFNYCRRVNERAEPRIGNHQWKRLQMSSLDRIPTPDRLTLGRWRAH